jgi:hypothetical protein
MLGAVYGQVAFKASMQESKNIILIYKRRHGSRCWLRTGTVLFRSSLCLKAAPIFLGGPYPPGGLDLVHKA